MPSDWLQAMQLVSSPDQADIVVAAIAAPEKAVLVNRYLLDWQLSQLRGVRGV